MISEVCVLSSSPTLVAELDRVLAGARIRVQRVLSGDQAVKRALCRCATAILIDDDPPDMNAAELLRQLRGNDRAQDTLVILLSSKVSEIDRVIAFELGADDFIPKPIGSRELGLRLAAVLRRHRHERARDERLRVGPFLIDTGSEEVACDGRPIRLTSVEFRLLEHLARNPGRVQDRRVLLERVWRWCDAGDDRFPISRTVDTHVKRLREKLGTASEFIETIRGVGYRLRVVPEAS